MMFSKRRAPPLRKPQVPDRSRIYVVGDVHGRIDLFDNLINQIALDLRRADCDKSLTVFLGDYVDRGPNSAAVLGRLTRGDLPTPIVTLRGNHEQMLLNFLEDEATLDTWRHNGGLETLHSYKIDVTSLLRGQGYKLAQQELFARMPEEDQKCFQAMKTHATVGDYFFCHAGVRPGVPLDRQNDHDLLWIRDEFLSSNADFGKIIVHGHTPVPEPEIHPNRINIDTGAFATNRLTCLILQGDSLDFMAT
jgi:serine/threonine protein phosphatase 1